MGNALIWVGILIVLAGIMLNFVGQGTFPRLPGDIYIQKENTTIYIPITSSILLSILLSLIFRFFSK